MPPTCCRSKRESAISRVGPPSIAGLFSEMRIAAKAVGILVRPNEFGELSCVFPRATCGFSKPIPIDHARTKPDVRTAKWHRPTATLLAATILCTVADLPANELQLSSGPSSPVSPAESLSHFETHPDLRIELVASEPQVVDPVAMAFDEQGRMWVVEMRDYPEPASDVPQSRIVVVQDEDHDGFFETSRVFAEGLAFANGVQPWMGGVIVTLAGQVAWLNDTDGDLVADVRQTWFSGFAEENPQLRVSHPTLAPDNYVYLANGLRGGTVRDERPGSPDRQPLSIRGMTFRFNPHRGDYGIVSGHGQFGLTIDDFGNRFFCSNRNPCVHVVLENRYLRRNPGLAVSDVSQDVSPAGENSHVHPISRAWTTSTQHAGQFTAACGVLLYRGDALPQEFVGNSFTCEPTGNLIHRDVIQPQGPTFTSRPGREGVEFLASRDEWFRPVNQAIGPDGALYVVDMYRKVIEHPEWMPTELRQRTDLRAGDDRGRIYRIVRNNEDRARHTAPLKIAEANVAELAEFLQSDNGWYRDTAARLLLERQMIAAPQLRELAQRARLAETRCRALWLLRGSENLSEEVVVRAISDADPRVRALAVALAEPWLDQSGIWTQVTRLAKDPSPRVRFQVALTAGEAELAASRLDVLARLAMGDAGDLWIRRAVLSSASGLSWPLLGSLLDQLDNSPESVGRGHADMAHDLAMLVAREASPADKEAALSRLTSLSTRPTSGDNRVKHPASHELILAALEGLGEGLRRGGGSLIDCAKGLSEPKQQTFTEFLDAIQKTALEAHKHGDTGKRAINVLAFVPSAAGTLAEIAEASPATDLRLAAIEALRDCRQPATVNRLVSQLDGQTPAVRRATVGWLLAHYERAMQLLDAIQEERISRSELTTLQRQQLLTHRNDRLRDRAKELLRDATAVDRSQVFAEYRQALNQGDPRRGEPLFRQHCATCHLVNGQGVNVGPDISDARQQTPEQLLLSILDPNQAIDANYFAYHAVTMDGQVLSGVLASETETAIGLRQPDGITRTLLREDIEELQSAGISLMPEGFEKQISPSQMADLVSYIKNWRYLDGSIASAAAGSNSAGVRKRTTDILVRRRVGYDGQGCPSYVLDEIGGWGTGAAIRYSYIRQQNGSETNQHGIIGSSPTAATTADVDLGVARPAVRSVRVAVPQIVVWFRDCG